MFVSVIICTIRRADVVRELLGCLHAQSHREAEILVVGGADPSAGSEYEASVPEDGLPLRFVTAGKGLARARNAGLAAARGEVICFLDDDVAVPTDFLARVAAVFESPAMADVGGITGYDTANYACSVPMRWRLRRLFGVTPSLEPGFSTPLGRSIPFSFLKPFSGVREVQWLPGFCQIFRQEAIGDLQYDEVIEVEDRDFSMEVGRRWRLLVVGELKLAHRRDDEARYSNVRQTWRASFGLGRSFAKRSRSFADRLQAVHVLVAEFVLDVLVAIARPSADNWRLPMTRANAFLAGYRSLKASS
jgi:glycosyltransferase involved in cell wall biosynthesis